MPRLGQVIPSLITNNNSLTDVVDEVRLYLISLFCSTKTAGNFGPPDYSGNTHAVHTAPNAPLFPRHDPCISSFLQYTSRRASLTTVPLSAYQHILGSLATYPSSGPLSILLHTGVLTVPPSTSSTAMYRHPAPNYPVHQLHCPFGPQKRPFTPPKPPPLISSNRTSQQPLTPDSSNRPSPHSSPPPAPTR